jgi:hypothetical protein
MRRISFAETSQNYSTPDTVRVMDAPLLPELPRCSKKVKNGEIDILYIT